MGVAVLLLNQPQKMKLLILISLATLGVSAAQKERDGKLFLVTSTTSTTVSTTTSLLSTTTTCFDVTAITAACKEKEDDNVAGSHHRRQGRDRGVQSKQGRGRNCSRGETVLGPQQGGHQGDEGRQVFLVLHDHHLHLHLHLDLHLQQLHRYIHCDPDRLYSHRDLHRLWLNPLLSDSQIGIVFFLNPRLM